jgi:hypothetical protein
MLIAFTADVTRSYVVTAYCPGATLPYYDWTARLWVAAMTPACLLAVAPDPKSPCGDLMMVDVPAPSCDREIAVQLLDLGPSGLPARTADTFIVLPQA